MSIEYVQPAFLDNQDPDTIYNRMKAVVPSEIDTSEGSFFYDATYPNAIEKSEMIQQQINEVIKIMFPQWSYADFSDLHAETAGLTRKPAIQAETTLSITGVDGAIIPKDYIFATPSTQTAESILFEAKNEVTISGGTASVPVVAVQGGNQGNVAAGTITLMFSNPIVGVLTITNEAAAIGGYDAESDEALISRMLKKRRSTGGAGSKSDYEEWAEEVPGIGRGYCLPEWLGPDTGTVKVVLLDYNMEPASTELINAVYNYIDPPDGSGKAPFGVHLTCAAPTIKTINYTATITPKAGYTESQCIVNIKSNLSKMYAIIGIEGTVKYSQVFSNFVTADGVDDVSGLTMNGATANIQLAVDEYAKTGTVNGQ